MTPRYCLCALLHTHRPCVCTDAGYSPDGARIVTSSTDGKSCVQCPSVRCPRCVLSATWHRVDVNLQSSANLVSHALHRCCLLHGEGTARVWDTSTGSLLRVLKAVSTRHATSRRDTYDITAAKWCADSLHVVTSSRYGRPTRSHE